MLAVGFATFVFLATFGAVLLGFQVRRVLPGSRVDEATITSTRQVLGLASILTTIVLGFVTASARDSFDSASGILAEGAVRIVVLAPCSPHPKPRPRSGSGRWDC